MSSGDESFKNPIGSVRAASSDEGGATAQLRYDVALIDRLKANFPRARWRPDEKAWFVPGKMAVSRLQLWLEEEALAFAGHDDARGRDAFAFDPLVSAYLKVDDELRVRTPYSKTVITELRAIPWARWDDEERLWHVPFRSYDELRRRWPVIEEAARRSEPEERKRRREAEGDTPAHRQAVDRANERRRHRYPVPLSALPLLGRPLMTEPWGIVVFDEVTGEIADPSFAGEFYPHVTSSEDYVWALWHVPEEQELDPGWLSRDALDPVQRARGWWRPSLADFRDAARKMRSKQRAKRTREHARSVV